VIDSRWAPVGRLGFMILAFALVVTGCATAATGTVGALTDTTQAMSVPIEAATPYPDAPREVSARWWLAPGVDDASTSGDPQERAAAAVLQSFFGSDSTAAMALVSSGPARVFADFMSIMELISGRHPMEEMVLQRGVQAARWEGSLDATIGGEITEDRSTGSGSANRTTYDQFVMRIGVDGQPRLVDFRRDGVWISQLVAAGNDVKSPDAGVVRIVAIMRSTLGRYMVAGVIDQVPVQRWSLRDARLVASDGQHEAEESFAEVGRADPGEPVPFLITFDDGGMAEHGAWLTLPLLDGGVRRDLTLEMPPLGVPRDAGDVPGR